jgi:hypothetical protein
MNSPVKRLNAIPYYVLKQAANNIQTAVSFVSN